MKNFLRFRANAQLFLKPIGFLSLFAIVFALSSCNSNKQKQASANVPAATPTLFPDKPADSVEGYTSSSSSYPPPVESPPPPAASKPAPKKIPPAPKYKPFALRDGETLVNHKVAKGEYLYKLSKQYGTSVDRIKAANGLSSDNILAGKTYKIPTRQGSSVASTSPPKPPAPPAVTSSNPGGYVPTPPPTTTTRYAPPAPTINTNSGNSSFTPRDIPYSGPKVNTTPTGSSGGGTFSIPSTQPSGNSSFPTPTFGAGSY